MGRCRAVPRVGVAPVVRTVLILAIETATTAVGVALHDGADVVAELVVSEGRRHAETLTPAIGFLCEQVQRSVRDVTAVVVDVGPGLFTGLRVGVATAKTIAMAVGAPLLGESSLAVLARQGGRPGERVAAVIDARRKELYAAVYDIDPTGSPVEVVAPMVASPDDVAGAIGDIAVPGLRVVGDGATHHRAMFEGRGWSVDAGTVLPSAGWLARAVLNRVLAGEGGTPEQLELLYLRAPDAQITWSNRHGAAS